jgi:hypothetical protein
MHNLCHKGGVLGEPLSPCRKGACVGPCLQQSRSKLSAFRSARELGSVDTDYACLEIPCSYVQQTMADESSNISTHVFEDGNYNRALLDKRTANSLPLRFQSA